MLTSKICKEGQDNLFRNNGNYCLPKRLWPSKILLNVWDYLLQEIIVLSLIYATLCNKFKEDQAIKWISEKMCLRLICVSNIHIN